ncbi:MAG: TIM barrel protein [Candidatus Tyrphobacter sp.]
MRLACASGAFDRAFARGDLTQLEFVDACARELACDGIVLDVRHFPRVDDDYLAQLKKMATDLGLSVAAYADDTFFAANADGMAAAVERAARLGTPLLCASLAPENAFPWSAQLARIARAASLAKSANVTLAVRNAPGTFAASGYDCKRVCKEGDSAWLRLGLEPALLDGATDPATLADRTVLLWCDAAQAPDHDRVDAFAGFRGFLALDRGDGASTFGSMRAAIAQRRRRYSDAA